MISVGQTWVSPDGTAYEIRAAIDGGFEVAVTDREGEVTASGGAWMFTPTKLKNLIKASALTLYNPSSSLDKIAEKLDSKRLPALAAALDSISQEYVEAGGPRDNRERRLREAKRQVEVLKKQLEEATDPENEERLQQELNDALKAMERVGPDVEDVTEVTPVNLVTKPETPSSPNLISK